MGYLCSLGGMRCYFGTAKSQFSGSHQIRWKSDFLALVLIVWMLNLDELRGDFIGEREGNLDTYVMSF